MLSFMLLLASASVYARGGFGGGHVGGGGVGRISAPVPVRIVAPVRIAPVVVNQPRVIVGVGLVGGIGFGGGYYGYNYGLYGMYPYWYPGFGWVNAPEPKACQKEKLKDEYGKKHEVLTCKQSDGSIKIFSADATISGR